ncbi:putative TIM-barrel fold metal-dependent hydrolase [Paraburkholderia sp. WC7.3g]|uniref:amidohydrolase family protein n=1 Tax=Paraburkholderia sp. WC7.3g TaxID=2991070 RepID=UPI003D1AE298
MIIDAHAHLGSSPMSNIAFYLRSMERSGTDMTIVVPGDKVHGDRLADFMRGDEPLISLEPANELILEAVTARPDKFYGFVELNPEFNDVDSLVEEYLSHPNIVGFKLNPLIARLSYKNPEVRKLFAFCADNELPIYTHLLMVPQASLDALAGIYDSYRPPLIIGHMGFASSDHAAVEFASEYEQVYLETSTGALPAIRTALRKLGPERLLFGSEGPSHSQNVELAKIRELDISDLEREGIMGRNVQNLISAKEAASGGA